MNFVLFHHLNISPQEQRERSHGSFSAVSRCDAPQHCVHSLSVVSARSPGDEVRVSDSDNGRHWCGISMIPAAPTDSGGDADAEPGATVKSLIKSFDTVGQSEQRAPQQPQQHTRTHVTP